MQDLKKEGKEVSEDVFRLRMKIEFIIGHVCTCHFGLFQRGCSIFISCLASSSHDTSLTEGHGHCIFKIAKTEQESLVSMYPL